jgi:hypothetical protein
MPRLSFHPVTWIVLFAAFAHTLISAREFVGLLAIDMSSMGGPASDYRVAAFVRYALEKGAEVVELVAIAAMVELLVRIAAARAAARTAAGRPDQC